MSPASARPNSGLAERCATTPLMWEHQRLGFINLSRPAALVQVRALQGCFRLHTWVTLPLQLPGVPLVQSWRLDFTQCSAVEGGIFSDANPTRRQRQLEGFYKGVGVSWGRLFSRPLKVLEIAQIVESKAV